MAGTSNRATAPATTSTRTGTRVWPRPPSPSNQPVELVVYITDGDPTAYDFGQPGYCFRPRTWRLQHRERGSRSDDHRSCGRGGEPHQECRPADARRRRRCCAEQRGRARGLHLPRSPARSSFANSDIGSITSINQIDVGSGQRLRQALAQFLRSVVSELCSPSLSICKLAQSLSSSSYDPAPGWDITVTPDVAVGGDGTSGSCPDPTRRSG